MSPEDPINSKREALKLIAQIDGELANPNIHEIEKQGFLSVRRNLVRALTIIDKTSMMKDHCIPGSDEYAAEKLTANFLERLKQGARLGSKERRNGLGKGPEDEGDLASEHC